MLDGGVYPFIFLIYNGVALLRLLEKAGFDAFKAGSAFRN
jgi:hypothetical protein